MMWVLENWDMLVGGVTAVLAAASAITRLTPTPRDDQAVAAVRRFLGRLSLLEHPDSDNGRTLKIPGKASEPPPHPDDIPE